MPPAETTHNPMQLDKRQLRQAFNKAAHRYEATAVLQREVGQRIAERLLLIQKQPDLILDVGSGTGQLTRILSRRYRQSRIIALDIAENMLYLARQQQSFWQRWRKRSYYLCADAEQIPLQDNSIDFIISNLALQWCDDLDSTLNEFRRLLRPDGLLMFSTFGPDTLRELRLSWQQKDRYTHINTFIDMHDIGDALLRHGFSDPVMDMENFTLTYQNAIDVMRELKQIGAHNVTLGRPRGLTGRRRFQEIIRSYEQFRQPDGLLPASYEVIYGHAWAGPLHAKANSGPVQIPLTAIKRRATSP